MADDAAAVAAAEAAAKEKAKSAEFWSNVWQGVAIGIGGALVTLAIGYFWKKRESTQEHYGTAFFLENGDVVVRPQEGIFVIEPDDGDDEADVSESEDGEGEEE